MNLFSGLISYTLFAVDRYNSISKAKFVGNGLVLLVFLTFFGNITKAQITDFPCRQYVVRQISGSGTTSGVTELGYVYIDHATGQGTIHPITTFDGVGSNPPLNQYNALAFYNGKLFAWDQYGSSNTVGGQAIVQFDPNGATPISTSINLTGAPASNAATIDPATGVYYCSGNFTGNTANIHRISVSGTTPSLLSTLVVTFPSTLNGAASGDFCIVGNELYIYWNSMGLYKFTIPSLSTTAVNASLVGTQTSSAASNNRTIGSTYWMSSDSGYLYGYGSATGGATVPAQDRLLKISISTGVVTELSNGGGTTTSQSDGAGCPDNPTVDFTNPLLPEISGNVFDDANALTDSNKVNGTGIGLPSGTQLYANLLNASGIVVDTVKVNADGTYEFIDVNSGTYSVQISTVKGTIGLAAPVTTLPNGWLHTGDVVGSGDGSAATPGLSSSFTVSSVTGLANATTRDNVNFGIEAKPLSVNQSYTITSPAPNTFITLNGSGIGSGSNPGPLRGSDAEDQPVAGSLSAKTIAITSLPTKGQLWYNGVQITTPGNIPNYNPALMQIKFTGSGYVSTSFGYSYVDAAGISSTTPATYTLNWAISLPVHLTSFKGSAEKCDAVLSWTTGMENGVDYFDVQYSTDGKEFVTIGNVQASGKKEGDSYSYRNKQETTTGMYRISMVDLTGEFTVSNTITVTTDCNNAGIIIFPNPATEVINMKGLNIGDKVMIYNVQGQITQNLNAGGNTMTINISGNAPGIYEVMVSKNNTVVRVGRIVKN